MRIAATLQFGRAHPLCDMHTPGPPAVSDEFQKMGYVNYLAVLDCRHDVWNLQIDKKKHVSGKWRMKFGWK